MVPREVSSEQEEGLWGRELSQRAVVPGSPTPVPSTQVPHSLPSTLVIVDAPPTPVQAPPRTPSATQCWADGSVTSSIRIQEGRSPLSLPFGRRRPSPEPDYGPAPPRFPCVTKQVSHTCGCTVMLSVTHSHLCPYPDTIGPERRVVSGPVFDSWGELRAQQPGDALCREWSVTTTGCDTICDGCVKANTASVGLAQRRRRNKQKFGG